ncbi:hypothetical protein V8J88_12190 [Massilia sp. W12]|uniref:hypothetical protein n=1 Tax=Massilia sp. W12 TaxID=3126507 RepID=UPI0030D0035F
MWRPSVKSAICKKSLPSSGERGLVALLFAGAICYAGPVCAASFEEECKRISHEVRIFEQPLQYQISHQADIRTLAQMHQGEQAQALEKNGKKQHVLGLTRMQGNSLIQMFLRGREYLQSECYGVQLELRMDYPPAIIYLARELTPDSCAWKEVLAHELRHVEAYRRHLPRVAQVMRQLLSTRLGKQALYFQRGTGQAALQRELNEVWMPRLQAELDKAEAEQEQIDSPAEYARLGLVCQGEIQQILRKIPAAG